MSGMRRVLANRDLRLLFGALTISATGSWSYNVALLAFTFNRTHSLGWVGAAGLVRFVPALVASPYGGVLAERFERVSLLVRCDLLAALMQALLVVVAASHAPIGLALLLSGLTSIAVTPYEPAVAALVPQLAGEDELAGANALRATIDNAVVIAGPAVGALMLLLGPPQVAFAVNAASFVVSAVIVRRLRARSRPSDVTTGGAAGPLAQILDGVRAMARSGAALPLVGLCGLASFVYGTDTVILLGAAEQRLDMGSSGFGLMLAAMGAGGILMALVVDRLAGAPRLTVILLGGMAAYCLPNLLVALTTSPGLSVGAQVVRGGGTLIVDVLAVTAIQRAVAPEMVARVFGIFFAIVLGSISLGTLVTPLLDRALGLQGALIFLSFAPIVVAFGALPALRQADRVALAKRAVLAPRVAILEGLGLFTAASRAVLERIAETGEEVDVAPGDVVVRQGDQADALYVVLDGEMLVTSRGEGSEERPIRTMGADTWFGEIGLLERIPRTATVTAARASRLLRLDGETFVGALTTTPPATTFVDTARLRLARTHPGVAPTGLPVSEPVS